MDINSGAVPDSGVRAQAKRSPGAKWRVSEMRLFCLVFLVLSLLSVKFTHAQHGADYLNVQVNEPSPAFSLSDVAHFEKRKVRLEDFKGKWLVLDFWSK